jgi:hypothetical protein
MGVDFSSQPEPLASTIAAGPPNRKRDLVSLREQRAVFLSLSCTEVVPKKKMISLFAKA